MMCACTSAGSSSRTGSAGSAPLVQAVMPAADADSRRVLSVAPSGCSKFAWSKPACVSVLHLCTLPVAPARLWNGFLELSHSFLECGPQEREMENKLEGLWNEGEGSRIELGGGWRDRLERELARVRA
eukprot:scaffold117179_cov28-Tisochrysis_lutea.AAC.9